jgi:hypothetical protein
MVKRVVLLLMAALFLLPALCYARARDDVKLTYEWSEWKGAEYDCRGYRVYITNEGEEPVVATIEIIRKGWSSASPQREYEKKFVDPGESIFLGCTHYSGLHTQPADVSYRITGAYYSQR